MYVHIFFTMIRSVRRLEKTFPLLLNAMDRKCNYAEFRRFL